jgi:adenosylcobinamide kinase/adenosylcobinamide-phosphate guanylyltransferase
MHSKYSTTLILGGARSGKSRHAQMIAEAVSLQRIYIATAEGLDGEMADRITRHQADRDDSWQTIEAPIGLHSAIERACKGQRSVLVDCLTMWLSNIMMAEMDVEKEVQRLCETVARATGPLILVSNEVGMGIVPDSALGRRFRDAQGRLNQQIAATCECVELIAAGLPLRLKG